MTISSSAPWIDSPTHPGLKYQAGRKGIYESPGSDGGNIFDANEILTDQDKALIRGVNGGSLDPHSDAVFQLKMDIASDRFRGTHGLDGQQGEVTPGYIEVMPGIASIASKATAFLNSVFFKDIK